MQDSSEANSLHADPLYLTALASLGTSIPAKLTAAPSKGSIAVLPFVDMSGETGHEHFTDGLTEDIITDLSNVPGFFVIARNSVFAYKGKPTDVRQIAHDLEVKYILEGSARRAGQRLRINVQLIDAGEGGNHVWAERFDRELADIFFVQDEVTRRIVETITGRLNANPIAERSRPSKLEAYDLCVRSRNLWSQSMELNLESQSLLERAIAIDPNYAEAHWQLAIAQLYIWVFLSGDQEPHRRNALISAQRSVELDPNDSRAHWALGYVLLHERRWDEAKAELDTSLRMNSNDADAFAIMADCELMMGRPKEALEFIAMALRLNSRPPSWYYWYLGFAQLFNGQHDLAVATLRREETYRTASRRTLAAALALSGNIAEAQAEAKYFLASNPHFTIRKWLQAQPFKDPETARTLIEGYRLAGLPE